MYSRTINQQQGEIRMSGLEVINGQTSFASFRDSTQVSPESDDRNLLSVVLLINFTMTYNLSFKFYTAE